MISQRKLVSHRVGFIYRTLIRCVGGLDWLRVVGWGLWGLGWFQGEPIRYHSNRQKSTQQNLTSHAYFSFLYVRFLFCKDLVLLGISNHTWIDSGICKSFSHLSNIADAQCSSFQNFHFLEVILKCSIRFPKLLRTPFNFGICNLTAKADQPIFCVFAWSSAFCVYV